LETRNSRQRTRERLRKKGGEILSSSHWGACLYTYDDDDDENGDPADREPARLWLIRREREARSVLDDVSPWIQTLAGAFDVVGLEIPVDR